MSMDSGLSENQIQEILKTKMPGEWGLKPVSSLEEVAVFMRESDEDYRYEHFLIQAKVPTKIADPVSHATPSGNTVKNVVPPPFIPQVKSQVLNKLTKEDISFLAQNANVLFEAGEIVLARNIYRAILKTGDASDVAYAGLARCSDQEGLIDQAIQFAWDSVAFAPNSAGYQILSQLLIQQGRDEEAAQALGRAIKSLNLNHDQQVDYYKMLGNCMARLGKITEAEDAYRKVIELAPKSDDVYSNLGSLYLERSQISESKRCYEIAISLNPGNDKAWMGFGLCCVAQSDKESAHAAFTQSLEKNLRNSTAIFHLVKCAYEIKQYSTAEKMLTNYVEVAPVSPSLLYSLAGLQFHVGKKREASQTAKRILQLKADHQGARDLIQRIESEAV